MFVNRWGQNEQSLERTFHRCFLPSFSSFGWEVSEEKIKMRKVNGRRTTDTKWWQKLTLLLARWAKNQRTKTKPSSQESKILSIDDLSQCNFTIQVSSLSMHIKSDRNATHDKLIFLFPAPLPQNDSVHIVLPDYNPKNTYHSCLLSVNVHFRGGVVISQNPEQEWLEINQDSSWNEFKFKGDNSVIKREKYVG